MTSPTIYTFLILFVGFCLAIILVLLLLVFLLSGSRGHADRLSLSARLRSFLHGSGTLGARPLSDPPSSPKPTPSPEESLKNEESAPQEVFADSTHALVETKSYLPESEVEDMKTEETIEDENRVLGENAPPVSEEEDNSSIFIDALLNMDSMLKYMKREIHLARMENSDMRLALAKIMEFSEQLGINLRNMSQTEVFTSSVKDYFLTLLAMTSSALSLSISRIDSSQSLL